MSTAQPQQCNPVEFSSCWNNSFLLACKRLIDVGMAAILLVLLFPFFLVLMILIKISSPGPVYYRWKVVGRGGRPFTGYKFRSMVCNADDLKPELDALNEMQGPVFKLSDDPRVTHIGHWLRRYSLDELPQLYSVLKGNMSLVGPRPPLVTEYERFTPYQKQKLAVKPGMTCLWQ